MLQLTEAGVRRLNTNLSAYLSRVKAGGTVIITEQGKPIGQIVPIVASTEDLLERLSEAGIVAWNGQNLTPLTPVGQTTGPHTVADLLLENRE